jgi:predicted  nucleic acid-binding Zn-ribbon protein
MGKKSNIKEFVTKSKILHGDKYDYSLVVYLGSRQKVLIRCIEHNHIFLQSPAGHLVGKGCDICGLRKVRDNQSKRRAAAKNKFDLFGNLIHANKYTYTNVEYLTAKDKVLVTCEKHGDFKITPNDHLSGYGCAKCYAEKHKITSYKLAQSFGAVFSSRATKLYGDNVYDYSEVVYLNSRTKVAIKCLTCGGVFYKSPDTHLRGQGCPHFASNGYKPSKAATLYLFSISEKYCGFGITNNFKIRHAAHKTTFKKHSAHAELITTYELSGTQALAIENHLKESYEIIDTGIEGFRKEATDIKHLPAILEDIKKFLDTI